MLQLEIFAVVLFLFIKNTYEAFFTTAYKKIIM